MPKDYSKWHLLKQKVNNSFEKRPFFHEREIWYCHLGENVGSEQDGKGESFLRPIAILRKFNNEIFWAIPLTSALKDSKYYYVISFGAGNKSSAILSQIRLVDAKRLSHKIGFVTKDEFALLIKKLKGLIP